MDYVKKRNDITKAEIIQLLRASGFRMTRQRTLLLDVILEYPSTSCKEIYYKASVLDASIGAATVYRMLHLLEEIGVLHRAETYQISYGSQENKRYCLILQDGREYHVDESQWYEILTKGMHSCGYALDTYVVANSTLT